MMSSRAESKIRRRFVSWLGRALAWLCLAWSLTASAQRVEQSAAQVLFDEGRALLTAGDYGEACPKLAESQRLEPASGTALNLALCLEKQGRTASAWLAYNEALTLSAHEQNAERQRLAKESIAELSSSLARLRLHLPARRPQGFELWLDEVPLGEAAWATSLPVDPGAHTIRIAAPGMQSQTLSVNVDQPGQEVVADIPELVAAVKPVAKGVAKTERNDTRVFRLKLAAGASLATGVLALATGTYFGLRARGEWQARKRACADDDCGDSGVAHGHDAQTYARISDVGLGVGAAAALTGGVLWLLARKTSRVHVDASVSAHAMSLRLGGAF